MRLMLNVPEQHDFSDPTVELDPRRLQNWLNGLPLLNQSECSYQVLHAIEPLNEQKIDSQLHFRLLNLYQTIVRKLYDADAADAVSQYRQAGLPRQYKAYYIEQLCMAMANGYKLVLKAWFADGVQKSDPQLFARALRRAFKQLSWVMLHCSRNVQPLPQHLLLEMHQLYRLARHFGVHSVSDSAENGSVSASLADYYQAAMLFMVLNPQYINPARQDRVFRTLLRNARDIHIAAGNDWLENSQGLYLIDLMSDNAPQNCAGLASPATGDELYIMDVNDVDMY